MRNQIVFIIRKSKPQTANIYVAASARHRWNCLHGGCFYYTTKKDCRFQLTVTKTVMDLQLYPTGWYRYTMRHLSISDLTETKAVTAVQLEPTVNRRYADICSTYRFQQTAKYSHNRMLPQDGHERLTRGNKLKQSWGAKWVSVPVTTKYIIPHEFLQFHLHDSESNYLQATQQAPPNEQQIREGARAGNLTSIPGRIIRPAKPHEPLISTTNTSI